MQVQELQIKKQEADTKAKKVMADAAAKADELALRKQEIQVKMQQEGLRIGSQIAKDKAQLAANQQLEGVRIGADVAFKKAQLAQQRDKPPKGNE